MSTVLVPRLIKQIYPTRIRRGIIRYQPIFKSIRVNSTTRICEMMPAYQTRALAHKNKRMENRVYLAKACIYSKHEESKCPMIWTKILCHACYKEIKVGYLYLTKNGERGKSKYYHLTCAEAKNLT